MFLRTIMTSSACRKLDDYLDWIAKTMENKKN